KVDPATSISRSPTRPVNLSCITTNLPSLVRWTSNSAQSTPNAMALSKAGSVFSGKSQELPRCAVTPFTGSSLAHKVVESIRKKEHSQVQKVTKCLYVHNI